MTIVMSYGNAMQVRRLKRARENGKKIQACIKIQRKSWSGFTALMDSMLRNSPYTTCFRVPYSSEMRCGYHFRLATYLFNVT